MSPINQIAVKVKCPKCGKSLMDAQHLLDQFPGIKLKIKGRSQSGTAWLSSLYGSYAIDCDIVLEDHQVYLFYCPHCKAELSNDEHCAACAAPVNSVSLETGGIIHFCSRKGCTKHSVEFEDLSVALKQLYENYDQYSGSITEI